MTLPSYEPKDHKQVFEMSYNDLDKLAFPPPPKVEQIMRYTRALEADPETKAIFTRMGKWGLPTADELDKLDAFRDAWAAENNLSEACLNGFFGANLLLRRIAWGQIDDLDDPKAMEFLKEDQPRHEIGKHSNFSVKNRIDENLWLVNYIRERCDFWPWLEDDWKHAGDPERDYPGSKMFIEFWYGYYGRKYGVINRGLLGNAYGVLQELIGGNLPDLDCKAAWEYLNDLYPIVGDHIRENLDV